MRSLVIVILGLAVLIGVSAAAPTDLTVRPYPSQLQQSTSRCLANARICADTLGTIPQDAPLATPAYSGGVIIRSEPGLVIDQRGN
jgi:hypothetical protein